MPNKSEEVIRNALRLLTKAKSMNRLLAAEYLGPLANLDEAACGPEVATTIQALNLLIASLKLEAKTPPEIWENAIKALKTWQAATIDRDC